jgi:ligand-binding SRPBCC domain-containing protein
MGLFTYDTRLAAPVERVFQFLACPANLEKVSPPDMNLRVVAGPTELALGARITVEVRRWGVSQKLVSEVTAFEANRLFADEQREGPFRKWHHRHLVEADDQGGTRMRDEIEFEPPGGLLGFVMTAARIEADLREAFQYREKKFRELFGAPA